VINQTVENGVGTSMENRMNNRRPWPLFPETKPENPKQWLENSSENIKKVTCLNSDGDLMQSQYIEDEAFVDPTALLVGGMVIGRGCYIGPYAVIRLDEVDSPEPMIMGEYSNIQDCAVIHSTTTKIGSRVIIAHQSIVHGAVIEDDVTIYIQAVVDGGGTVIGKGSFLHQGSYVGKNIQVAAGRYVAPGVKILTQEEADSLPSVPPELVRIAQSVLKHNKYHAKNHLCNISCME
jgi:carbonic anhydrase/acetyltransferase-like protein (isoleucine patch superfamily)